jgi:hypothetical protein
MNIEIQKFSTDHRKEGNKMEMAIKMTGLGQNGKEDWR